MLGTYAVIYGDPIPQFDMDAFLQREWFDNFSRENEFKLRLSFTYQSLSKSKCWEHEKEWRTVIADRDSKVWVDIVSGIIIDERSLEKTNAEKLIRLCKRNGWALKVRAKDIFSDGHFYVAYEDYVALRESCGVSETSAPWGCRN